MTTTGGVRPQPAVRTATTADHMAVLELLNAAALPVAGVPPTLTDFWVAVDHGQTVGAIGLELYGPDALLRSAVVDPAFRGTGIGVALVECALNDARQRGVRGVYLLTTTAEHYFRRFEFDRITREDVPPSLQASVELREACPASAAVMRKTLERRD